MFCKYKDIFGKVGQGTHSRRLFNIAIVDLIVTIIIAFIIHLILKCILLVVVEYCFAHYIMHLPEPFIELIIKALS